LHTVAVPPVSLADRKIASVAPSGEGKTCSDDAVLPDRFLLFNPSSSSSSAAVTGTRAVLHFAHQLLRSGACLFLRFRWSRVVRMFCFRLAPLFVFRLLLPVLNPGVPEDPIIVVWACLWVFAWRSVVVASVWLCGNRGCYSVFSRVAAAFDPFFALALVEPDARENRVLTGTFPCIWFHSVSFTAVFSSSNVQLPSPGCQGNTSKSAPMEVKEAQKKRIGLQNDVNLINSDDEHDPWTAWAYKPRTITLLLLGACLLIWASGALDPESTATSDVVTSVKRGIWAMISVFLAYCLLQAPSTVLIRPHPAIWRLVHGMAVVYLVALTFLLFQNRDDARQFMKFLHSDLGIELPERSYGSDCRIYVPENPKSRFINVYDTLFDEFVLAHIFGWWGKAIMIRNQPLLWVLSIGFELMELTFRHMLPNFNECWWDSIILDILICNWFGIWAGMRTVQYFDGKTYEWVGLSRQPSIIDKIHRSVIVIMSKMIDGKQVVSLLQHDKRLELLEQSVEGLHKVFFDLQREMPVLFQNFLCNGKKTMLSSLHPLPPIPETVSFKKTSIDWGDKNEITHLKVKRSLSQFTPARWDKDQWHPLLGPWRFVQVLSLCIVFMTVELNTFFLKFCLWIPPRNPMIVYRLILWWLIAIPAIREYNNYLQDSKPLKKVGAFCWLSLGICMVELLICIKFGQGLFPDPMPRWLIIFWASVGASLTVFLSAWACHNHRTLMKKRR
ncbi:hypothetical protein Taro_022199, partial [Colocasia esculenta]|nr:hypothetical protein [Colocasia esculenta]